MKRIMVSAACALALAAGLILAVNSTATADTVYHVANTGNGLYVHPDSATIHSDVLPTLITDGTPFDIQCWAEGDDVNGDAVWDYGTNETTGDVGYASDYYLDTPVHQGTEGPELTALGIPMCGSSSASTPTSSPVNIQLFVDGTREQHLLGLSNELQAAADAAGIDGQELARVIYHEGGNYLGSPERKYATQAIEQAAPGAHSVGIGQMLVATARMVDAQVYGADDSGLSDDEVKSRLIYDQNYAIFMAAGYLRVMQDEGIEDGWPQFMAYSMSPELALSWKEAGHPMDTATLESLGADAAVEQARQQSYNDAVNAIG